MPSAFREQTCTARYWSQLNAKSSTQDALTRDLAEGACQLVQQRGLAD